MSKKTSFKPTKGKLDKKMVAATAHKINNEVDDSPGLHNYTAKDGKQYYDIQIGRGVLLPGNPKSDKSPDFRGPFNLYNLSNEVYSMAVWKRPSGGFDVRLTLRKPSLDENKENVDPTSDAE